MPTVRVISTNGPEGSSATCIFNTDLGAIASVTPTARWRKARPPATERADFKRDTPRTLGGRGSPTRFAPSPFCYATGYPVGHDQDQHCRLALHDGPQRRPSRRRLDLLIMRQAFSGTRRFEDFQKELGISRNILTSRLNRLVEEGLLSKGRVPAAAGALRVPAHREGPRRLPDRRGDGGLWRQMARWRGRHAADPSSHGLRPRHARGRDVQRMCQTAQRAHVKGRTGRVIRPPARERRGRADRRGRSAHRCAHREGVGSW